jgi:hypothetical protein
MRAIVIVAALAGIARADDAAKQALQLFDEGKVAAKAGDYATACEKYQKSLALDATNHGVELNLGDCQQRQGHFAAAVQAFEAAAAGFEKLKDSRAKYAHDQAAAAAAKLATVVVRLPSPIPTGTAVKIGDRDIKAVPEIETRVDPGELVVVVTAPGRTRFEKHDKLAEGAHSAVDVVLPETTTAAVTPPPAVVAQAATGERQRSRVHLAWGLAGGGVVAIATTTVLSVVAKKQYNDVVTGPECTQHPLVCTSGGSSAIAHTQTLANVGTGFAIAGVALLAGAGVVYYTAPREGVVVAPSATATSVGLVVGRRF